MNLKEKEQSRVDTFWRFGRDILVAQQLAAGGAPVQPLSGPRPAEAGRIGIVGGGLVLPFRAFMIEL
jgi:hypothetical protein